MKNTDFWDVTTCSRAEMYLCLRETCCLYLYCGRVSCSGRISVRWKSHGSASKLMAGSAARNGQGQNNPGDAA